MRSNAATARTAPSTRWSCSGRTGSSMATGTWTPQRNRRVPLAVLTEGRPRSSFRGLPQIESRRWRDGDQNKTEPDPFLLGRLACFRYDLSQSRLRQTQFLDGRSAGLDVISIPPTQCTSQSFDSATVPSATRPKPTYIGCGEDRFSKKAIRSCIRVLGFMSPDFFASAKTRGAVARAVANLGPFK